MITKLVLISALTVVRGYLTSTLLFPTPPLTVLDTKNELCNSDSKLYVESVENNTLWAYEMWDATAKSVEGVLKGNVFHLGDFDECISARAPFPTQYCIATITAHIPDTYLVTDPLSLEYDPYDSVLHRMYDGKDISQQTRHIAKIGWCIPASCGLRDLNEALSGYLEDYRGKFAIENVTYSAEILSTACQMKQNRPIESGVIAFCLVSLILIILMVAATTFDFFWKDSPAEEKQECLLHNIFMAFSVRKNFVALYREEHSSLGILYGVRFFCCLLIINGHRFILSLISPIMNADFLEKEHRNPATAFLLQGHLIVDSFFTLSGILVTYSLLTKFEKVMVNPFFVILWRYIRLIPVYAFVLFYYATLMNYVGSGPMWKMMVSQESLYCKNNWYINLLFMNNYINDDSICMVQTWYLCCDFHYFIIAVFICMIIVRNKKLGLGVLLAVIIASVVSTFIVFMQNSFVGLFQLYTKLLTDFRSNVDFRLEYIKSHTRATPYFVGMVAGYLYYKMGDTKQYRFTRLQSTLISAISAIILLGSIFCGSVYYDPYHPFNAVESAAYASLIRGAWSLGTIGILFAASHGHIPLLKSVLSWSPWVPLSKLAYAAYLTHMLFQLRYIGMMPAPITLDYFAMLSISAGDCVMAFSCALLLYLAIEEPFRNIFKHVLFPSTDIHGSSTTSCPERTDTTTTTTTSSVERKF